MRFSHRIAYCVTVLLVFAGGALFGRGLGEQQDFPSRPIRIIVPYAQGGGTDVVARGIARIAGKYLDQPIYVENILGSSGATGMISGAAAIPDGYTVTMVTRELVSLPAVGVAQISKADFKLLCMVNKDPAVLAVTKDSPFDSLDALIAAARSKPGKIRFASAAKPHFYVLEFERQLGLLFNKIPYNGAAISVPALIAGQADFTLANPGELKPWIDSGKVRCIAVLSHERNRHLPDVPTVEELGYDITSYTWRGLAVPAGTPEDIRQKLAEAFARAALDPEYAQLLDRDYYSVTYLNADDFSDFIDRDWQSFTDFLQRLPLKDPSGE